MNYYFIDLEQKIKTIETYEEKYLNGDIAYHEVDDALELSDYDWRVFDNLDTAKEFLDKYLETEKKLRRLPEYNPKFSKMLYKRRYLVQSAMGLKNSTVRHYYKPYENRDIVFHDQTYAIVVRVKSVKQIDENEWEYNFEVL